MEPAEVQSIKSMLHIARILAIIFGILLLLGGVVYAAYIAYLSTVCSTYIGYDAYCGSAVAAALIGAIYLVIAGVFLVIVYMQMKSIEAKVNAHQYEQAKAQTLIWMILGFIFGIILGIILLLAYIKFDPVINQARAQQGMAPPGYAPPVAPGAPMAAPMPPPPAAQPAAAPICPKCGQPTTYVAQYGRYYCYTDRQYV
ncbi:MAG: hypothetical protein WAN87_06895 [Thermoplasmata archaeon]